MTCSAAGARRSWPVAPHAFAESFPLYGKITTFTAMWDGSLRDDPAVTALAAHAVDR